MRKLLPAVVVVVAVVVSLARARPAAAAPETLDQILARNAAARGDAKLRALKGVRMTGKVTMGGGDFSLDAAWALAIARPGMVRAETTLQGLTAVSAFDGKDGWSMSPFGGRRDPERSSADDARSLAQTAELEGPLFDGRARGHAIELLGIEDVDGTPAYKLRVTRKDGDVQYVFVDPDSALEIRITTIHKVRGAEEISETDLGNYQQVGGVWFPFALESGGKGGPRGYRVLIDRIELDPALDAKLFALPAKGVAIDRTIVAGPPDKAAAPVAAPPAAAGTASVDAGTISGLGARNLGSATMSGRIAAIAAREDDGRTVVFVGAASGGVWKSTDNATTFKPVFDKQPVQSIGAIAIDPTSPKTIWVGTGEGWTRNSVSVGDGIYKSTDDGETWTKMGLPESERITRIVVHPRNGNVVYACVPGKLWSDSADRGLYKTTDGGKSWTLVLAGANRSTGCSSVTMDPKNPEQLIAGLWDFRRQGWTFRSGGDGPDAPSASGMFRSTDGGKTWTRLLAGAGGLPATPWGRVEVTYAPTNNRIVYAMIESKASALFRSDDGGATWEERDKSQMMVWRPFYFARLVVDPTNPNRLFKMDGSVIVSEDGGKSFASSAGGSHGDWHDLWIDPKNPKHAIGGDDGGLWLSYDGGTRWNKNNNLPISQFYHVSVDAKDPYNVYGGLQDNSTWVAPSSAPGGVSNASWQNLYGGDGFWAVVDPSDPDAVYVESQGGYVGRFDRRTNVARDIQPKAGYKEKLRFNWNSPIHASPTQKGTIYLGAQVLFRSRDRGTTWQRISPDLTTNDPAKQKQEQSGGVTVDNSSAEMHTTIYAISESPKNAQVIWVGTDDGNVQVTRDGGKAWTNVTANVTGLPPSSWVSYVSASRFDPAVAYATFDRHTYGDLTPWVYRTGDYGKTWTRLPTAGVRGYAHVIVEDTVEKRVLFLGTEHGLWISTDAGATWSTFTGGDFPTGVAVRDLAIQAREDDLVIATHGRGIWIVDDIAPLRALSAQTLARATAFLPSRPTQQRMSGTGGWVEGDATFVGANPATGAVISYYLRARHVFGPIKLEVFDAAGKLIDTVTPTKRRGINRVQWSMRVKGPRVPRAAQVAFGASQGPRVLPGTYTVKLTRGSEVSEQKLVIGLDRRAPYSAADRKAQYDGVMRAHALFEDMSKVADQIEAVRAAITERASKLPPADALTGKLRALLPRVDAVRKQIVATTEGGAITGEERIREHLEQVYGQMNGWEGRPGDYMLARVDALHRELEDARADLKALVDKDARALDAELKAKQLAPIPPLAALIALPPTLDRVAIECLESRGLECGAEAAGIANERD